MKKLLIATLAVAMMLGASLNAEAALLGVAELLDVPDITSNSTGTYSYDSTTNIFDSDATPLSITFDGVTPISITGVRSYDVSFEVDESGNFVSGVGGDDLVIIGDIDVDGDTVIDYSGVLLTGEVTDFGWLDIGVGSLDLFDFTFDATGGALAGFYGTGKGGDVMTAEQTNFTGSFLVSSSGTKVKHDTAPLVPEPTSMMLFGTGLLGFVGRLRKRFGA